MKSRKFVSGAPKFKSALTFSASFAAIAVLSMPAHAQDAAEEDESRTLQTVTITATKREQTLQDVPVAVSVVDEAVIEKAEIVDLGDLQSIVPSLRVSQQQSSANTNFIIRGFGNGANNAGIEPSVGVFVDGVYRSRSNSQISDLPNLQRVEVLRGPQSTLFGKNASAGVISIVTQKPQFEWGGNVEGTVSNYNGYRLGGYVTGPISDKLAFSLGGNFNKRDGYVEDLGDGPDTNERNRWGLRGDLLFEPTDDMSFRLIADYDEIDEICCAAANVVNGPTGAAVLALGGNLVAEDPFSYQVAYNFGSENQIKNGGLSLQGDFDLGAFTLTSITAYRTSDLSTNQDSDFTSADILGRKSDDVEIETFTQEVRLTSNGDGPLSWMVGGFYFDETVDIENQLLYGQDTRGYIDILTSNLITGLEPTVFGVPVGTFFAPGAGFTEFYGQDDTSASLFGTVDYEVTDRLTATFGLNYTQVNKNAFSNAVSTDAFAAIDLNAAAPFISQATAGGLLLQAGVNPTDPAAVAAFAAAFPTEFATIQATAAAAPTSLQQVQFLPPFLNFPNAVETGSTDDEDTSVTFRLAYDVTDAVNVYASYATGFKASSWNLSRDSRPTPADYALLAQGGLLVPNLTTGTRFAGPEESKVYEIGVKGAYADFAFNVAIFDQTIEGFQSNVFTGTGFALANAGEQSTQGLELDAQWNATENLLLSFAGTFLDPVYDSFEESASGDISGQKPYGIPEVSTSTAATYTFNVKSYDAFVRADWQYESPTDYFDDPANQALIDDQKEISTFNASAGLTTENGLSFTLWGRNIFDDEYITVAFPAVAQTGSISGYPNQPATYGLTVRKTF
ncbi:TonB-dependent receptor [Hyphomonas sp.]|uniref:TonB-dependent receptor n=1 Tax=Hyphomonas sp. TaxID=87 RepID=UPI0025C2795F|nr:TonB-dependent receptor [Hyphomonas sp.]